MNRSSKQTSRTVLTGSGLDVVRMLALGADGVLLGRAWAYALAGAGGKGVSHLLELMAAEMKVAMALTGVTRVDDIDGSVMAARSVRPMSENA